MASNPSRTASLTLEGLQKMRGINRRAAVGICAVVACLAIGAPGASASVIGPNYLTIDATSGPHTIYLENLRNEAANNYFQVSKNAAGQLVFQDSERWNISNAAEGFGCTKTAVWKVVCDPANVVGINIAPQG